MSADEIKELRRRASVAFGDAVSQRMFGAALGLSPYSAARRVQYWESDSEPPSAPIVLGLEFLDVACNLHSIGEPAIFDEHFRPRFERAKPAAA
jgi:hypothetical protein